MSEIKLSEWGGIPQKCMPGIKVYVVCDKIIMKNSMYNK